MASATQLGLPGPSGSDITKTANIFMDLAVLTSLCDANRVIFMKMPSNGYLSNACSYTAADGTMKQLTMDATASPIASATPAWVVSASPTRSA